MANLSADERAQYEGVFRKFDVDGDGSLTIHELCRMVRQLGYDAQRFPDSEVANMFIDVDTNRDNRISLQEFLTVFGQRPRSEINAANLTRLFHEVDIDGSGTISVSELKAIFEKNNIHRTDAEIRSMLQSADRSGDGEIDLKEFLEIFG